MFVETMCSVEERPPRRFVLRGVSRRNTAKIHLAGQFFTLVSGVFDGRSMPKNTATNEQVEIWSYRDLTICGRDRKYPAKYRQKSMAISDNICGC